jgi:hypothetical protein
VCIAFIEEVNRSEWDGPRIFAQSLRDRFAGRSDVACFTRTSAKRLQCAETPSLDSIGNPGSSDVTSMVAICSRSNQPCSDSLVAWRGAFHYPLSPDPILTAARCMQVQRGCCSREQEHPPIRVKEILRHCRFKWRPDRPRPSPSTGVDFRVHFDDQDADIQTLRCV